MTAPESKVPDWLTEDFLAQALASYTRDVTVKVIDFKVTSTIRGHYASSMFPCFINFKAKSGLDSISVMVKAKPVDEPMKMDVLADGPLFETEIRLYREILPAMHDIYERSGQRFIFGPELIYITESPLPIIILRDMSADGFTCPTQPPESFEDSKALIKRLSQFHAASFVLSENHEVDFTGFDYTVYGNDKLADIFFTETLQIFKEVVETWDGFEQFLPNIENLQSNAGAITKKCFQLNKPGMGYNVLNHGDFHTRNLLLKTGETGKLEDFLFIDFQTCIYASPAIDVCYMLGIVRRDENGFLPAEELFMFYHEEFVKAVRSLGYLHSLPSLLDLNIELLRNGAVSMLLSIFFIPFSFVDWSKMNPEDMLGDGSEKSRNFKKSLYEHPMCKKIMQSEIKKWVHKGWI